MVLLLPVPADVVAPVQPLTTSRRFAVVTTCHAAGYDVYGRTMLETFDRHWPPDVQVHFYPEAFDTGPLPSRVRVKDLLEAAPELVAFKARHHDDRRAHGKQRRPKLSLRLWPFRVKLRPRWGLGFRWDAVRFSHKSFALLHAAAHTDADVLIWVDSDTRFFADVTEAALESFAPTDCFVGCLRRKGMWTETGFVAYNLRDPMTARFFDAYRKLYVDDELFAQREYHDAYLFDRIRERVEAQGARSHDIAQGAGDHAKHVLVNSILGSFMDHMKGDRKVEGSSRDTDRLPTG